MTSTEMVEKQNEVEVVDFGDDSGKGMENISKDERRLPFLRILDPKSPQCKPTSQGGLPSARGGMIINTSTNQIFDGELGGCFVPSFRDYKFVEYIRREEDGSGGGFVNVHAPNDPKIIALRASNKAFGKISMGFDESGKEHELSQTMYLYGTFFPNLKGPSGPVPNYDAGFRCLAGFASTQIKKFQAFVTRYENIRYPTRQPDGTIVRKEPPLWAHRLSLRTQYESKGAHSWYGWVLDFYEKNPDGTEKDTRESLLKRDDPLYISAREFHFQIAQGLADQPDYQAQGNDEGVVHNTTETYAGGQRRSGEAAQDDENIPF